MLLQTLLSVIEAYFLLQNSGFYFTKSFKLNFDFLLLPLLDLLANQALKYYNKSIFLTLFQLLAK